ncbi:autotransporter outer membrane beta-barrel domain-containing protein [Serratia microhaemolytica]|uniref:autotransporter outer membrane beta-barrel domain-containing protein n=1 Tax=Serratia microhaemolytica TaxID=2675110 RepID=UPI001F0CBCDE|nr:autotransporter outer membrane beta-barrel domain-containing protein [Serratia microhaemolytica]
MKKSNLALSISLIVLANSASANEIGLVPNGLGNHQINAGSTITSVGGTTAVTGVRATVNDQYTVVGSGGIDITLQSSATARGVSSNNGSIDLNQQTNINVTGGGSSSGVEALSGGRVRADQLTINVNGGANSSGINIQNGGVVDLTGSSTINVTGTSGSNGVYLMGSTGTPAGANPATLNAENLTINSNGVGINAQTDSRVTLTGKTVITSAEGGITAWGSSFNPNRGGTVTADSVTIKTTAARGDTGGLFASLAGIINVGAGSSIETANMHGIFATTIVGFPTPAQATRINYSGTKNNRNTIRVNGQSGVTTNGADAIVNLDNTDVYTEAKNSTTIGLRAISGSVINANNSSVQVSDAGTAFASLAAVVAQNQDAAVNFTGNSLIDASNSRNGIALLTSGTGSKITVKDSAIINGDVFTQGNNTLIDLDLNDQSMFTGRTLILEGVTGKINVNLTDSDWRMTGNSDLTNLTLNSGGRLHLNSQPNPSNFQPQTLTVQGDYHGNYGELYFNGVLAGDDSPVDQLIIKGNSSGTSFVAVNNLGGMGAATLEGIKLIQVDGLSDGTFVQSDRIVAGAYEYSLMRGLDDNANNWYLSSRLMPEDPDDALPPPTPEEPDTTPPFDPKNPSRLRPEPAAYYANLAAANHLFAIRLHDRIGETQYTDMLTGQRKVTSMWLRSEGGHSRFRDEYSQLKTRANRYVLQLGGDVAQWSKTGLDRFHLGIMAGYGNSHSNSASSYSGYRAKGTVEGYSVGSYATWYANTAEKTGMYLDAWVQYGWFDNTVEGQSLASEEYQSSGMTGSIETGYTFKIGENVTNNTRYFIQPKVQVTWMGIKADDHVEANGTHVSSDGDGNLQIRLGAKAFVLGFSPQRQEQMFQPFIEANWLHNSKEFGTSMNEIFVKQSGANNIGELKLGVEGQLSRQFQLWGNISQQLGDKGYSDTSVLLGVKYHF